MISRFVRSWELVKASARVLSSDKQLLLFPLLSSVAALLVLASFITPAWALGWIEALDGDAQPGVAFWVWVFLFYVTQYFVIFFFNSALVGAALIRLRGGVPTLGDGLRIASSRIGTILGYAVIAATVGLLLRAVEQRVGFVGRIVIALIGTAWTVATFLAVPVLVSRDVGPVEVVKQSAALLKRSWGENLVGNVGIGLVFGLFWVLLAGAAAGLMAMSDAIDATFLIVALGSLLVLAGVLLALVQAALQGVYSAALYRYASEGEVGAGFESQTLAGAFRAKA